ncbi:MAG TPA: FAD-dependent oxidoreductase [Pirellulales bacterium]
MKTHRFMLSLYLSFALLIGAAWKPNAAWAAEPATPAKTYDVVIVGGTPGGIMAAIAAARQGKSALLLDRTSHVGGLPANGLGATDIATRGCTGGLFLEFVGRIKQHYIDVYGPNSAQVKACSDGYHFESSVAEKVFERMLSEHPQVTVLKRRQFDADSKNVTLDGAKLTKIRVVDLDEKDVEEYVGKVFVDATYEGDLAAAAGAPFRTRREGKNEYNEPLAGRVYKQWRTSPTELGEGSTGEGDDTIQAFNYRLCLTKNPENRVAIEKPANYNRDDYASIVEDVKQNRWANKGGARGNEIDVDGIGRVVNIVTVPNGKTDANNQHAAFVSTDLPEENYPWPTADWAWRDRFAQRLREYTLGLLWFVQNDPELPEDFRERCRQWGLAKDEYTDNGNFPRQVYVREGRRVEGEHLFVAHDALPVGGAAGARPPIYSNSVTSSHYALDSHAHHKREPGRVHLDGFLSHPSAPYTVPYGVIVPKKVENLLTPVPVSGTHIGFSTLRMEPCWMALGQAAGTAAAIAASEGVAPREVNVEKLQDSLVAQKAILIYFRDVKPSDPWFAASQYFGLRKMLPSYTLEPTKPLDEATAQQWIKQSGVVSPPAYEPGKTSRGEFLQQLFEAVQKP